MTLGELALLVGAPPKWVLNAAAVIPMPKRYSLAFARRLSVARAIQEGVGIPLSRAFAMAGEALRQADVAAEVALGAEGGDGAVAVRLQLRRLLSEFNIRRSQLATSHAPRRRGPRRSRKTDPLRAASEYGIDLTLLQDNLRHTPEERLRQLDGMIDFARRVRRVSDGEAS